MERKGKINAYCLCACKLHISLGNKMRRGTLAAVEEIANEPLEFSRAATQHQKLGDGDGGDAIKTNQKQDDLKRQKR